MLLLFAFPVAITVFVVVVAVAVAVFAKKGLYCNIFTLKLCHLHHRNLQFYI